MTAYDAPQWSDLFVATAGAGAALAGLVFVAVSINIERILASEGLPERALETVLTLLIVVIVSIVGLIPGQSATALGVELLVVTVVYSLAVGVLAGRETAEPGAVPRKWLLSRMVARLLGALPLLIGAISLLAGSGGGLYWIVAGIVAAIFGGVTNAWVLLVEILR